MANVVIGTMDYDQPSKVYLLTSECLEKVNHSTIAQLFTTSLSILWPEGIKHESVLLFVSDAAPYMTKAGKALKVLFPEMVHLKCLAHALHRVAEEVRSLFPDVDQLISNGKKIFLKSPSRIQIFKDLVPDLALPPQPVLTRWGTWISAAIYYANNLTAFKEIVNSLDEDSSSSIKCVKKLLQKKSIESDLVFIASNYYMLPDSINAMEKRNETLENSLKIVENAVSKIASVRGTKGCAIREKCDRVFSANSDLDTIKRIEKCITGNEGQNLTNIKPENMLCFKYAPITSVEVERSFSKLKYILSDRRQNFTADNLKKVLVINCNIN